MASPDKNKSLRVTGKLAYGCTDLSTDWPHGGTGLGLVGSVFFEPPSGVVRIQRPENNTTEVLLYVGGDATLGASVEGWDDTVAGGVLAPLFPARRELDAGRVVLEWPGSTDPDDATQVTSSVSRPIRFYAATKKIVDTTIGEPNSFVADGFVVGMTLTVGPGFDNSGTYTITAVTATEITVAESLVNEGPVTSLGSGDEELTINATMDPDGARTATLPGQLVPTLEPLVFSALNPARPSLIIYNAAPMLEASARLRLSSIRTLSVPLMFLGTPDATGRVAAQGRLADLEL